jgi:hypothetical protein
MSLPHVRLAIFLLVVVCVILVVSLIVVLRGRTSEASSTYQMDQVRVTPQDASNPAECSSEHYRTRVKVGSPISRPAQQVKKKEEENR